MTPATEQQREGRPAQRRAAAYRTCAAWKCGVRVPPGMAPSDPERSAYCGQHILRAERKR